ncbi:MAG: hypothetical protein AAGB01_08340 [Cyanobacteria bacterium P01_F01_bin.42]
MAVEQVLLEDRQENQSILQAAAFWTHFDAILTQMLGDGYDSVAAHILKLQLQQEDCSKQPWIEEHSNAELKAALGAYAVVSDIVCLSQRLLETASQEQIVDILFEEIGHGLDARINSAGVPRDEVNAVGLEDVDELSTDPGGDGALSTVGNESTPGMGSYCYSAFSITIESEIRCPELLPSEGKPSVTFRYGDVPITWLEGADVETPIF